MASYIPKTAPDPELKSWPPGIPYIIGNEGCERFSYYGMKAILFVYIVGLYMNLQGSELEEARDAATETMHLWSAAVYALPLIGAIISDRLLGKYRTILYFSLVYCGGHLALGLNDTRTGLATGLALIALGAGGIKPCVSANVGDQFGVANQHLLTKVFGAFYFAINLGAFASSLITPVLLEQYGPHAAFGLPGVLMGSGLG